MKKNRTWLRGAALLILVLLPALLLFYTGYTLPRQLNRLEREIQRQLKYSEISADIYHLTTSVQEYILYGDEQALNNFRHYIAQTEKKELELYNLAEQSRKQDIAELMTLTRTYRSFVEREVVPLKKFNDRDNRELLLWQYRDLTRQLVYRADSLAGAGRQENKTALEHAVALLNIKGLLMVILSLLSLGAFGGGYMTVRPWLARHLYLGTLVRDAAKAVIFIDRKERVQDINPAAENLFHLSREAVMGKSLGEILLLYPHLQNIVQPLYHALWQKERITDYRLVFTWKDARITLGVDCTPIHFLHKIAGAVLVARRTSEPEDGNILLDTIERERKRLSIEIHDWIGRYLSSIIHGLDYVLRVNGERLPGEVQENLLMLRTQCQNAAVDMRSIMNDIHPYIIEKVGLIPALESYSANFERMHNKKVYIFYHQRSLHLPREKEILIYRIVQEALTNVARHSQATEVDIHFTETNDNLQIEILDNGGMQETTPVPGKGLWGMKERARLLGGDLVYGFMEGGFAVTLTVPLVKGGK
ncbi:PAS domain-containing protein [Desulfofundulus sp. TPOSR]|jgi:PAS domain S-box-containing protein|uniref:sensor histidine kinase n=1 Tax=Desulfofundulus sp. TPOSR TaxID=2714340 RepID=UPI00140B2F5A|nr:histidine kinase [Desulfofundulus sp. TPOSR]NHM26532.1 PAS domain-containing protein [Desulfofundulus sp. TPOSR]